MWAHPVAVGANIKSEAALKVAKIKVEKEVKKALESMLSSVVSEVEADSNEATLPTIDLTKTSNVIPTIENIPRKRKRYDFSFKMKVIEDVEQEPHLSTTSISPLLPVG